MNIDLKKSGLLLILTTIMAILAVVFWGIYFYNRSLNSLSGPFQYIRQNYRVGDLVFIHPRRNNVQLLGVGDIPVVPYPSSGHADFSGFERIWVVSSTVAKDGPALPNNLETLGEETVGGFTVRLFKRGSRGDSDALKGMTVSLIAKDGGERLCQRKGPDRIFCGPNHWNFVGLETVRIAGRDEHCIWAHPQQAATVRISLPDASASGLLIVRTMLADSAPDDRDLPVVDLAVRQAGKPEIKFAQVGKRQVTNRFNLSPGAPFQIDISTEREAALHFCFHMEW